MAFGQSSAASTATGPGPRPAQPTGNAAAAAGLPYPVRGSLPVYPGLAEFMGMELSEEIIRENMPEYLAQNQVAVRPQVSEWACACMYFLVSSSSRLIPNVL